MNKCDFIGNFVADPELKDVNGTSVSNFSLAVRGRSYQKDGEWKTDVAFIDCEAWDTGAERIVDQYSKGDPILVYTTLKMEKWVTSEGQNRSKLRFRVNSFERLPNRELAKSKTKQETASVGAGAEEGVDGNTPF